MRCSVATVARDPRSSTEWAELDRRTTRSVFCTAPWMAHLARTQGARPVLGRVHLDGEPVGWFTGAVVQRAGVRVLGSPLPGWGTSYMGFDWDDPGDARLTPVALAAVRRWSVGTLGCVHTEVLVRVDPDALELAPSFRCSTFHSYRSDLVDDDTLLSEMSTNARRNLVRGQRRGVQVEAVEPGAEHGFAETYYSQARASFARRGSAPAYGVERVRSLIDEMHPSGRLLLLRALTPDGRVAATSISAGTPGGTAVFLMGAAEPSLLADRPNEAVMWAAMRAWRDRGAVDFDFGGGGIYKEKFGCRPVESAWVRTAAVPGVEAARGSLGRAMATLRRRRAQPVGRREG